MLSGVGHLALALRMRLAAGRGGWGRSVLCPSFLHVPTEHQSELSDIGSEWSKYACVPADKIAVYIHTDKRLHKVFKFQNGRDVLK